MSRLSSSRRCVSLPYIYIYIYIHTHTHALIHTQKKTHTQALERYGTTEGVVPRGTFQEGDIPEVEHYTEFMDMAK